MSTVAPAMILSGFIMGFSGFGFAMAAISILSFSLELKTVIPFIFPYNLMINLILLWHLRNQASILRIVPQVLMFIPGAFAGSLFLYFFSDRPLKIIAGFTLASFCIWRIKPHEAGSIQGSTALSGLSGLAGGFLGGAVYMPGPPVIMYNALFEPNRFRFKANLQIFFLVSNLFLLCIYTILGLFSKELFTMTVRYIPYTAAGLAMGMFASARVSNRLFRQITLVFMASMGIAILFKGIV